VRPLPSLLLTLLLAAPAVAAPWSDEADAVVDELNAAARYELAAELAQQPETETEAVMVLEALLDDPQIGSDARALLARTLLLSGRTDSGWRDLYLKAADAEPDPRRAYELRIRAAVAAGNATDRAAATREMTALRTARPSDDDATIGLGHIELVRGNLDAARDAFRRAPLVPEAREGLLLVAMTHPFGESYTWWQAALVASGVSTQKIQDKLGRAPSSAADVPALQQLYLGEAAATADRVALKAMRDDLAKAVAAPTRILRATVLERYGYSDLAMDVLEEKPPSNVSVDEEIAIAFMLGRLQEKAGDDEEAAETYQRGLALDPGNPELRRNLAMAHANAGDPGAALAAVGANDEELRALVQSRIDLAAARKSKDKLDDGPALAAAYKAYPIGSDVAASYGRWLHESRQCNDAVAVLGTALSQGWDADLANRLVDCALHVNKLDAAFNTARGGVRMAAGDRDRGILEQSLSYAWVRKAEGAKRDGKAQDATDAYAVAHALLPTDAGVLRGLGGTLWGAGEEDRAFDVYAKAFALDPTNRDGIDGLVKLGLQLDRETEVRALLERQASKAPVRTALRDLDLVEDINAADRLRASGDLDGAWLAYRRLQSKSPNNPAVLRGMASIALARGQEAEALELFAKARKADPGNDWARLSEVDGLIAVKRFSSAENILDDLATVDNAELQLEVARTRARLEMAKGVQHQKDDEDMEAFEAYQRALSYDPNNTWIYTNLGSLYAKHGQYGWARACYEEAADLDDDNLYARLGLVGLQIDRGHLDDAEDALDALPQSNEDVIAAQVRIEVIRAQIEADDAHRIGEHDRAREIIKAIYDTYPDNPAAKAAWEVEVLDVGTVDTRLSNARAILVNDPRNLRALGTVLDTSHTLRTTQAVLPLFETAAKGGTEDHEALLVTAQLTADLERAVKLHEDGRHSDAVGLVEQLKDDAGDNTVNLSILGGTWLQIDEPKRAEAVFVEILDEETGDPDNADGLIGLAGTYATQGKTNKAITLLEDKWITTQDPRLGLALADLYQSRRQFKAAYDVLTAVEEASAPGARIVDELPDTILPSGREVIRPYAYAADARPINTTVELKRRELKDKAPDGWKPGFDVGVGVYSRPGFSGEQFLTAFFIPVRLHELRAGRVSFDVEAVPYILSDAVDSAQGVQVSGGLQADLNPVGLHLRVGSSPLGFRSRGYLTWYGSVDVGITEAVRVGFITSRETVADSLTSWAGKLDASGNFFGRVHRTGFGGYLGVAPTPESKIAVFGRGGWNEGLGLAQNPFWEAGANGGYEFMWPQWGLEVGADVLAMSFRDQQDKFRPGQGGYFSPPLFVNGGLTAEGKVRTKDDRLHFCLGGKVGAQYLDVEDPALDPDNYIQPGVFFGYALGAGLDWQIARFWWLGVDYGRTVTGNTWAQNIAMVHLHFGPNDAWSRSTSPVFSPSSGMPVIQAQPCN
jgi:tetratricopeptide (TPR) repeat protein